MAISDVHNLDPTRRAAQEQLVVGSKRRAIRGTIGYGKGFDHLRPVLFGWINNHHAAIVRVRAILWQSNIEQSSLRRPHRLFDAAGRVRSAIGAVERNFGQNRMSFSGRNWPSRDKRDERSGRRVCLADILFSRVRHDEDFVSRVPGHLVRAEATTQIDLVGQKLRD